jgi:hypothetical protein
MYEIVSITLNERLKQIHEEKYNTLPAYSFNDF